VFFFLSEYSSIVLFSALSSALFFGGYSLFIVQNYSLIGGLVLGLKTCFICALFVGARALLPRYRYTDLISLCWLGLLPLVISITLILPSLFSIDYMIEGLI